MGRFYSRLDTDDGRFRKLENRSNENIQTEIWRKKVCGGGIQKGEKNDIEDSVIRSCLHLI